MPRDLKELRRDAIRCRSRLDQMHSEMREGFPRLELMALDGFDGFAAEFGDDAAKTVAQGLAQYIAGCIASDDALAAADAAEEER